MSSTNIETSGIEVNVPIDGTVIFWIIGIIIVGIGVVFGIIWLRVFLRGVRKNDQKPVVNYKFKEPVRIDCTTSTQIAEDTTESSEFTENKKS